ncbi:MAG: hypothetical protein ACNA7Q_08340, partial [Rhodobacterales bacterium]
VKLVTAPGAMNTDSPKTTAEINKAGPLGKITGSAAQNVRPFFLRQISSGGMPLLGHGGADSPPFYARKNGARRADQPNA